MPGTKPKRGALSRLLRVALFAAMAFVLAVTIAVLNNNYSVGTASKTEVRAQIDRALDSSIEWLSTHKQVFDNPALMFMVIDMQKMSKDPRLTALVDGYRQSEFVDGRKEAVRAVWMRMIDSTAIVPKLNARGAPTNDIQEILWDAYAVAPEEVQISETQRSNMFSRTRYWWGRRNHQLHALNMYRYYNGSTPSLDTTVNTLSELVARDQFYDFRVNDSYPQRIAFVLGAARPDLVRRRWLDRLLAYQNADGSWNSCWYHWCKGVLEFKRRDVYQVHTTPQAMWGLYLLKYRYAGWIDEHYR